MNKENLLKLADFIEVKDRFDLGILAGGGNKHAVSPLELRDDCGSVGCVVGWACALFAPEENFWGISAFTCLCHPSLRWVSMRDTTLNMLDLTDDEGDLLFFPSILWEQEFGSLDHRDGEDYTAKEAAVLLRKIADGEVKW